MALLGTQPVPRSGNLRLRFRDEQPAKPMNVAHESCQRTLRNRNRLISEGAQMWGAYRWLSRECGTYNLDNFPVCFGFLETAK